MCKSCDKPVPHKHAELIKAWADGAEIEFDTGVGWKSVSGPCWSEINRYRIKPTPKPDLVRYFVLHNDGELGVVCENQRPYHNIKYTLDGNTGVLKSVEMIK